MTETVSGAAARRGRGRKGLKMERVFLPGMPVPVAVPEHSYGFRLLTHVRDEAHRFAVNYHRRVRRKATMDSPLLEIRGVGRKTARRLLEHLGGLNKVRQAGVEELKAVPGISNLLAAAIHAYYHPPGSD